MPKETTSRRTVRRPTVPQPPVQSLKTSSWKLKRLSQLMAGDPSIWGVAWALLWRIMVLLLAFRTIIVIIKSILYYLANIS